MRKQGDIKWYKKLLRKFRNKYLLTFTLFVTYVLFIDDNDIFTLINYHIHLHKTRRELADTEQQLRKTKEILQELDNPRSLEKYARENKYFKKDDEEIFVITYK
ncbi:MAG: hypothetical protein J0G96_00055 [Flavobacteriia bacterium]|nr:hypothetical protein [Flavobacteriia bacterium]OJX38610.1 MAG: hypothetical protein BGO87_10910 [Flavobacteriia bacterium 40-80]